MISCNICEKRLLNHRMCFEVRFKAQKPPKVFIWQLDKFQMEWAPLNINAFREQFISQQKACVCGGGRGHCSRDTCFSGNHLLEESKSHKTVSPSGISCWIHRDGAGEGRAESLLSYSLFLSSYSITHSSGEWPDRTACFGLVFPHIMFREL